MAEKRGDSRAAMLGFVPGATPVALGCGTQARPTQGPVGGTESLDESPSEHVVESGTPPSPSAAIHARVTREPSLAPAVTMTPDQLQRQAKVDALMDRLGTGRVRPVRRSLAPKTHHVTISLPKSVHAALAVVAGDRQVPALIRDSLASLMAEAQFRSSVAFKTTLAKSYEAFVEVRRSSRSLQGEGLRTVTIPMNNEESGQLVALSKQFGIGPIPLLEVLAYEMVQNELESPSF